MVFGFAEKLEPKLLRRKMLLLHTEQIYASGSSRGASRAGGASGANGACDRRMAAARPRWHHTYSHAAHETSQKGESQWTHQSIIGPA